MAYNDGTSDIYPVHATYDYLVKTAKDLLTNTGTPRSYWIEENYIGFYPYPDYTGTNNVTMNYIRYAQNLSDKEDVCEFNTKYLEALSYLSASIVSEKNEQFEDSVFFKRRSNEELVRVSSNTYRIEEPRRRTTISYTG